MPPRASSPARSRLLLPHAALAVLLLALHLSSGAQSTTLPAATDAHTEVARLMRAGQIDEALARAERHLQERPRDPQMRFMQGVLQDQKGLDDQALATFQRLTEEFPELPEPHNNLAVMHAAAGRHDQARVALEAALRANPQYAIAHENLGDVHARLAEQSWARALQIDAGNARLPVKLRTVRELLAAPPPTPR